MRVLLIEDELTNRILLRRALNDSEGPRFEILECERISAAIGILEENGIDAVILDLGLPDNIGLEGISRLRAVTEAAIVVWSGAGHIEDAIRAIRTGADSYMVKAQMDVGLMPWGLALAVERRRRGLKRLSEKDQRIAVLEAQVGTRAGWKSKETIIVAVIGALATLGAAALALWK